MKRWDRLKTWEKKIFPMFVFFFVLAVICEYLQTAVIGPRWVRWHLGDFTSSMAFAFLLWVTVGWRISYGLFPGFIAEFLGEIFTEPLLFGNKIDVVDTIMFVTSTTLAFSIGYYFHKKSRSTESFFDFSP
jgi:hypothetical protein